MRRAFSEHVVRAMPEVHLHIGRVVVDAGVGGVDARTLPAALESALGARFDATGTQQERPRVPSTTDAIADAIAAHVTSVAQTAGGGRA